MSNKKKDGLTTTPLTHNPFSNLSLDALLGNLDDLAVPSTVGTEAAPAAPDTDPAPRMETEVIDAAPETVAETIAQTVTEDIGGHDAQMTETTSAVAPAETPRPLTLTPSGTGELMDDADAEETFGSETDDGLEGAAPTTSLLPPPLPRTNVRVAGGNEQTVSVGIACEQFMFEASREDGTIPVGARVTFSVIAGNGSFDFMDSEVQEDGTAAAVFIPSSEGMFIIECLVENEDGDGYAEVSGKAIAQAKATTDIAAMQPTPALVTALEHALPTVKESIVAPAPAPEPEAAEEVAPEASQDAPAPTTEAAAEPATLTPEPTPAPEALHENEAQTAAELAKVEAELRASLGLTSEDDAKPEAPQAPSDEQIDRFVEAAPVVAALRNAHVPKASPIPREERGTVAAVKRSLRSPRNKVAGWRGIAAAVAALAVLAGIANLASSGSERAGKKPAALLQADGPATAPAATPAAATGKLVYRCDESTRKTDHSDGRFDTLTCHLVAK